MLYQVIEDGEITYSYSLEKHDDSIHTGNARRNIANGLAGLDANLLRDPTYNSFKETYINHEGTLGNYLEKTEIGGTVIENSTTHQFDISIPADGNNSSFTSKDNFTLSSKPLILSFLVDNIVLDGTSLIGMGFGDSSSYANGITCILTPSGLKARTSNGSTNEMSSSYTTLSDGDLITIIGKSSGCMFFKNGVIFDTITGSLPLGGVNMIFSGENSNGTNNTISIDNIFLERYI